MQVSKSKSKVVADSFNKAVAVANGVRSGKVTAATIAQLLGTDAAGGRRRRTSTQQERFRRFSSRYNMV